MRKEAIAHNVTHGWDRTEPRSSARSYVSRSLSAKSVASATVLSAAIRFTRSPVFFAVWNAKKSNVKELANILVAGLWFGLMFMGCCQ